MRGLHARGTYVLQGLALGNDLVEHVGKSSLNEYLDSYRASGSRCQAICGSTKLTGQKMGGKPGSVGT